MPLQEDLQSDESEIDFSAQPESGLQGEVEFEDKPGLEVESIEDEERSLTGSGTEDGLSCSEKEIIAPETSAHRTDELDDSKWVALVAAALPGQV